MEPRGLISRAGSHARAPVGARRGFTLIELLVVITIIGVMIGGALLSLGVVGVDRRHEQDAERLAAVLNALRDRAELESREYGLIVDRQGYRVLRFEPRVQQWTAVVDATFSPRRWRSDGPIELRLEGRAVTLMDPQPRRVELEPQFGVDAVGEFTGFSLTLPGPKRESSVELSVNAEGELQILRGTDR